MLLAVSACVVSLATATTDAHAQGFVQLQAVFPGEIDSGLTTSADGAQYLWTAAGARRRSGAGAFVAQPALAGTPVGFASRPGLTAVALSTATQTAVHLDDEAGSRLDLVVPSDESIALTPGADLQAHSPLVLADGELLLVTVGAGPDRTVRVRQRSAGGWTSTAVVADDDTDPDGVDVLAVGADPDTSEAALLTLERDNGGSLAPGLRVRDGSGAWIAVALPAGAPTGAVQGLVAVGDGTVAVALTTGGDGAPVWLGRRDLVGSTWMESELAQSGESAALHGAVVDGATVRVLHSSTRSSPHQTTVRRSTWPSPGTVTTEVVDVVTDGAPGTATRLTNAGIARNGTVTTSALDNGPETTRIRAITAAGVVRTQTIPGSLVSSRSQITADGRINAIGYSRPSPESLEFTAHVYGTDAVVTPQARFTAQPPPVTNRDLLVWEFDAQTATSRFECQLDPGAFTPCTSPVSRPAGPDGTVRLRVRAVGPDGIAGDVAESVVRVDRSAPTIALVDPLARQTGGTVSFRLRASEVVGFECRIDDDPFQACGELFTRVGVAVGAHRFEARAIDEAGNVSDVVRQPFEVTAAVSPEACSVDGLAARRATPRALGPTGIVLCGAWPRPTSCPDGREAELRVVRNVTAQALEPGACFTPLANDNWVSSGPIRINGLIFEAVPGRTAKFTINTRSGRTIWEGKVQLALDQSTRIPLGLPKFTYDFDPGDNTFQWTIERPAPIGAATPSGRYTRFLANLPLTRGLTLAFDGDEGGRATLSTTVHLPWVMRKPAVDARVLGQEQSAGPDGKVTNGVTGEIGLQASNQAPPRVLGAISVDSLRIGQIVILAPRIGVTYGAGGASLALSGTGRFGSPLRGIAVRVALTTSGFTPVQASVVVDGLNKPLPGLPVVFVQGLGGGFDFRAGAALFSAEARLTLGPEFSAPAYSEELRDLSLMSVGGRVAGGYDTNGQPVLKLEGSGTLLRDIPLSDLSAEVGADSFKADAEWSLNLLDVIRFDSRINHTFKPSASGGRMPNYVEGQATLRVTSERSGTTGITAQLYAENDGIAYCVRRTAPPTIAERIRRFRPGTSGTAEPSFGFTRDRRGTVGVLRGCDVSTYRRNGFPRPRWDAQGRPLNGSDPYVGGLRQAPAGPPSSFAVPAGIPMMNLVLTGSIGVPRAVLTDPAGRAIQLDATTVALEDAGVTVVPDPVQRTVSVSIRRPRPGTWSLRGDDLVAMDGAWAQPAPTVRLTISPRGTQRVAAYSIAGRPSDARAELFELASGRTARRLALLSGARGRVRFAQDDRPGRRLLEVRFASASGVPRQVVTAGVYTSTGLARPRVERLRARRLAGGRLVVSWRPGAAASWIVDLTGGGRSRQVVLSGDRRAVVLRGVPAGRLTVRVQRTDRLGRRAQGTARLAAR